MSHGSRHSLIEFGHSSSCGRQNAMDTHKPCLWALGPNLRVQTFVWVLCLPTQVVVRESLVYFSHWVRDFLRQSCVYLYTLWAWRLPVSECLLVEASTVSSYRAVVVLWALVRRRCMVKRGPHSISHGIQVVGDIHAQPCCKTLPACRLLQESVCHGHDLQSRRQLSCWKHAACGVQFQGVWQRG